MNCHHCYGSIEKADDVTNIVRNKGCSLSFHTHCFEEIAGKEYVPRKSLNSNRFHSDPFEPILTVGDLEEYIQTQATDIALNAGGRDCIETINRDLTGRVPIGITTQVTMNNDLFLNDLTIEIRWIGVRTFVVKRMISSDVFRNCPF